MPTPTKGPRLGGSPTHERMILAALASQLFEHGRITTTETKAKRMRPLAEKLITKAKRGDLHARRLVLSTITDKGVVHKLFTEIAPAMAERDGGYVRITKVGNRKGDNAPMAAIELVMESVEDGRAAKAKAAKKAAPKAAAKPAAAKPAKADEPKADEVEEAPVHADAPAEGAPAGAPAAQPLQEGADAPAEGAADAGDAADAESKFGEGSYVGANPPAGFDIKGNEDSMKYHTPESPYYDATVAEVWFNSVEAAQKAGFEPTKAEEKSE